MFNEMFREQRASESVKVSFLVFDEMMIVRIASGSVFHGHLVREDQSSLYLAHQKAQSCSLAHILELYRWSEVVHTVTCQTMPLSRLRELPRGQASSKRFPKAEMIPLFATDRPHLGVSGIGLMDVSMALRFRDCVAMKRLSGIE